MWIDNYCACLLGLFLWVNGLWRLHISNLPLCLPVRFRNYTHVPEITLMEFYSTFKLRFSNSLFDKLIFNGCHVVYGQASLALRFRKLNRIHYSFISKIGRYISRSDTSLEVIQVTHLVSKYISPHRAGFTQNTWADMTAACLELSLWLMAFASQ